MGEEGPASCSPSAAVSASTSLMFRWGSPPLPVAVVALGGNDSLSTTRDLSILCLKSAQERSERWLFSYFQWKNLTSIRVELYPNYEKSRPNSKMDRHRRKTRSTLTRRDTTDALDAVRTHSSQIRRGNTTGCLEKLWSEPRSRVEKGTERWRKAARRACPTMISTATASGTPCTR